MRTVGIPIVDIVISLFLTIVNWHAYYAGIVSRVGQLEVWIALKAIHDWVTVSISVAVTVIPSKYTSLLCIRVYRCRRDGTRRRNVDPCVSTEFDHRSNTSLVFTDSVNLAVLLRIKELTDRLVIISTCRTVISKKTHADVIDVHSSADRFLSGIIGVIRSCIRILNGGCAFGCSGGFCCNSCCLSIDPSSLIRSTSGLCGCARGFSFLSRVLIRNPSRFR